MDYTNIHEVPGREPGETGLRIVSTKKLKEEEKTAREKAKYLNSKKGLIIESAKMSVKAPFKKIADQVDKWIQMRLERAKPPKEIQDYLKNVRESK
jgi:hypothetical protein